MERWTDELLERMRDKGDPFVDDVIATVVAGEVDDVNRLLEHLVENDDVVPGGLSSTVREYFDHVKLPDWADPERIRNGQDFFNRHFNEMCLLLSLASLPTCYACQKGAEVLVRSQRLADPAGRRIFETTQFVLDVMDPGGLDPDSDGRGLRSIQKVRLMHAAIRHLITAPSAREPWDNGWGKPINQEDLAVTLMSFSRTTIKGLEKFGHKVSTEDEEDFFHTWRVIGHLMGICDELLPQDASDGQALLDKICHRQWGPSPSGQELTKALIKFIEHIIPGTRFDGIAAATIRFLLGDKLCEHLDVPQIDSTPALFKFRGVARLEELFSSVPGAERLTSLAGKALLQGLRSVWRGGKRTEFRIPSSL